MTDAFEPPAGHDDPPPLRPRPLAAYGGPRDGAELIVSADGHTWFLDVPGVPGTYHQLGGDVALREHWATALALGDPVGGPRPTAAAALGALAGVYALDAACNLSWCALQPMPRDPSRPAARWRLRALLVYWESACLIEAYQLVGDLAEVVAVREAWWGVREVQVRAWGVARAAHYHRERGRPRPSGDHLGPPWGPTP